MSNKKESFIFYRISCPPDEGQQIRVNLRRIKGSLNQFITSAEQTIVHLDGKSTTTQVESHTGICSSRSEGNVNGLLKVGCLAEFHKGKVIWQRGSKSRSNLKPRRDSRDLNCENNTAFKGNVNDLLPVQIQGEINLS